ncbi:tetratricopeptide repeat-containing sensor histidine kinase [Marinoscillum furvescens]|uniref:histidine kinase n=1 Tax=Marinoscillum furvescens DSM 4134 TaxID=1122208 RepID=A0A3D9L6H6_MARFU|nr:sensor histidine kinase [Marinoscillum furvescens]REE01758.1 histidine kinase/DNA gyrase B/HSP90-like ATPase [Marinoscillum furvescens DSM 4134]
MKVWILGLGVLLWCACEQSGMPHTITDDAKWVDSVNTHFYKIYSRSFEEAKELTSRAVRYSQKNQWPEREALAQKNHSVIMYMTGHYDRALAAGHRSYDLYDSLKDISGMARICNELGNYYRKAGDPSKALAMWDEAEHLAKEAGDQEALGTAYGMKGTFYWIQKDFERSDAYYLKSYQIRVQEQDSVGLGYALIDLADMEQRKGNLQGAEDYFRQSNDIRSKIGDYQGLVDNYKMMGDMYRKEQMWPEAIQNYEQCIEACSALGYPDLARKSYDSLASIHRIVGDYDQAFYHLQKAEALEDSLFNIEKSKVLAELQTKYETEKKERLLAEQQVKIQQKDMITLGVLASALILLTLGFHYYKRKKLAFQNKLKEEQNKLREAQITAAITSQEKERSRFAKDLHDGFGQLISILNLNLRSLENNGADRQSIFAESEKVLEEMYGELKNICFNLMPQTLIKNGLPAAVREFAARVSASGKLSVQVDFFGLEERLSDLQEISLYRITQEWVNNILKYSDASRVTIQLTRDEQELTLLIEDNGQGFEKGKLLNGSGNGWKNMNSRANLINGELELDTVPGRMGNTLIVNATLVEVSAENLEKSVKIQ